MNRRHARAVGALVAGIFILVAPKVFAGDLDSSPKSAQSAAPELAPAKPVESLPPEKLAAEQSKLAAQFADLEKVFLLMAEDTARTDPRRAALLRQAFKLSQEQAIHGHLDELAKMLGDDQLFKAAKSQQEVQQDLTKLLELLLSGDRSKQVQNEKALLRQFIARINGLIKKEQGIQNKTSGEGEIKELAERQNKLADEAGELAKDILKKLGSPVADKAAIPTPEDANSKDGDKKPPEGKPGGKPSSQPEPAQPNEAERQAGGEKSNKPDIQKDSKTPDAKPGERSSGVPKKAGEKSSDPKKNDSQPHDSSDTDSPDKDSPDSKSKPSQGKSPQNEDPRGQQGQPQDDEASPPPDQKSPQDDTPARKRIQAAEQKMREAFKKLEEAKRKQAGDEQEKALQELEIAKAELEAILRQLREEQTERVLALFESRFRHMLQLQTEVYDATVSLDKTPAESRDRDTDIEAGKLSRKEAQIAGEADRALSLMRQEGSGTAMPLAVEQMRDDMEQVTARLAKSSLGGVTQGIEKDVISALEEMIAALQKAQKDQKQKKPLKMQPGGDSQDPPLIDQIADLKMIRALQMRINTRHERYSKLVEGEQADKPELLQALDRLAEREEEVHRAAREIVQGLNR